MRPSTLLTVALVAVIAGIATPAVNAAGLDVHPTVLGGLMVGDWGAGADGSPDTGTVTTKFTPSKVSAGDVVTFDSYEVLHYTIDINQIGCNFGQPEVTNHALMRL